MGKRSRRGGRWVELEGAMRRGGDMGKRQEHVCVKCFFYEKRGDHKISSRINV